MPKFSTVFLFLMITLLAACNTAAPPASQSPTPKTATSPTTEPTVSPLILAYFTGTEESLASLQAYAEYLDILSVDVFILQDIGNIFQDPNLISAR